MKKFKVSKRVEVSVLNQQYFDCLRPDLPIFPNLYLYAAFAHAPDASK